MSESTGEREREKERGKERERERVSGITIRQMRYIVEKIILNDFLSWFFSVQTNDKE